ncbi:hypothetical protein BO71DRAFT_90111 [Aspergillus ellipticus CBS 707.79]|uniref:Uncharacterized protein n=1 Tax=Aspergillus ellipticus CBS 707.79 TaxID=1448320 RepID=A0A319CZL1_9EURO|nr:hypothetical protein BO71DRAFT_90111 [Aspergillus ellipticus CBS 707.79]
MLPGRSVVPSRGLLLLSYSASLLQTIPNYVTDTAAAFPGGSRDHRLPPGPQHAKPHPAWRRHLLHLSASLGIYSKARSILCLAFSPPQLSLLHRHFLARSRCVRSIHLICPFFSPCSLSPFTPALTRAPSPRVPRVSRLTSSFRLPSTPSVALCIDRPLGLSRPLRAEIIVRIDNPRWRRPSARRPDT